MKRIGKLLAMLLAVCMLCTSAFAGEAASTGGFALKVSASVEGSAAQEVGQFLDSSFIQLAAASGLFDAQVSFAGMDLFRLLAQVNGDLLTVAMPNISDNSYTISSQRVQELFGDAIEQISGQLEEGGMPLDQLQGIMAPDFDPEELTAAFAPYMEIISQFLQENMRAAESETITLEKLGKTVENASVMYVEPDSEDFVKLFGALADQLENDENLEKVVKGFAAYLRQMDGFLSSAGADSEMTGDSMSPGQAADALEQGLTQLPQLFRETVEDIQTYGMDAKLTLTIALNGSDPVLMRFDAKGLTNGENLMAAGMEMFQEENGQASFALFLDQDGEEYVLTASAGIAGEAVTGTVQFQANGVMVINIVYNFDLTKQSMLGIPYGTCVITSQGITLTLMISDDGEGGNNHMIRLDGIEEMAGEGISAAVLNINTSANAAPEAPSGENIDISGYSMEELQNLGTELIGKYSEFLGSIFG